MTEKDYDEAYDKFNGLWEAIGDLVDKHTEGLSEEMDDYICTKLSEDVKFWRE